MGVNRYFLNFRIGLCCIMALYNIYGLKIVFRIRLDVFCGYNSTVECYIADVEMGVRISLSASIPRQFFPILFYIAPLVY